MAHTSLGAALLDVGGTLCSETRTVGGGGRVARLGAMQDALGHVVPDGAATVVGVVRALDERPPRELRRRVRDVIAEVLTEAGLPCDVQSVEHVRRAMCVGLQLGTALATFPHTETLLRGLHQLGLRCVVVANTTFLDADALQADFARVGWGQWIDGVVTSLDLGYAKPDARIFQTAMEITEVSARQCVMIGNREDTDILGAAALGMRTIRVAIDERPPTSSAADAVVNSVDVALRVVQGWNVETST